MKTPRELEIEELEKQEQELLKGTEEPVLELQEEAIEDVATEDEVKQDEEVVEPKQEDKKQEEPAVDHAAIARANYEARELKRRNQELQEELERLRNPQPQIPKREEDWEGHIEAKAETLEQRLTRIEQKEKEEKLISAARSDMNMKYENAFIAQTPDYEAAKLFIFEKIASQIYDANPKLNIDELRTATEKAFLIRSANLETAGLDPAYGMYEIAKRSGYSPKQQEQEVKKVQPQLKVIAENKKRTAGTASGSGSSSGRYTASDILNMSNAQRAKLSQEDWDNAI